MLPAPKRRIFMGRVGVEVGVVMAGSGCGLGVLIVEGWLVCGAKMGKLPWVRTSYSGLSAGFVILHGTIQLV